MDRRLFLKSSGMFVVGNLLFPKLVFQALADITKVAPHARNKTLVVIFQRGAVDGLSMIPPLADPHYNAGLRPSILLSGGSGAEAALPLDGFFGLHPGMKELLPYWNDGRLAVIHQVGLPIPIRSHFDAQDYTESGTPGIKSTDDGFLNRALLQLPADSKLSSLRGIALQPNLPRALWGSSGSIAFNSIKQFSGGGAMLKSGMEGGFESMYGSALDQALRGEGKETFDALKTLRALPEAAPSAHYPKSALGNRLSEIAKLIRGEVGVKIAMTDCGGWDTHQRQGGAKGQLANHLSDFSKSISAFVDDLGSKMDDVCLVTLTEFGRTAKENGNGGTDHGHGSVMLVLGNRVKGKQVVSHWKNLATENLFEGRDVPVTTDFRDVWREILSKHLAATHFDLIFPGFKSTPIAPLFKA
jgi:uncharacterized protein (DUF1501 family)